MRVFRIGLLAVSCLIPALATTVSFTGTGTGIDTTIGSGSVTNVFNMVTWSRQYYYNLGSSLSLLSGAYTVTADGGEDSLSCSSTSSGGCSGGLAVYAGSLDGYYNRINGDQYITFTHTSGSTSYYIASFTVGYLGSGETVTYYINGTEYTYTNTGSSETVTITLSGTTAVTSFKVLADDYATSNFTILSIDFEPLSTAPEPATMGMAGFALVGIGAMAYRRRRRA